MDNYLKVVGLPMTTKQYYRWRGEIGDAARRAANKGEKKKRADIIGNAHILEEKYKKVMEFAKEDWILSTDGVVKALRYWKKKDQFVAKVHYKKGTEVMEEQIPVEDDWVIDTYGKELAKKLMDREDHSEFIFTHWWLDVFRMILTIH